MKRIPSKAAKWFYRCSLYFTEIAACSAILSKIRVMLRIPTSSRLSLHYNVIHYSTDLVWRKNPVTWVCRSWEDSMRGRWTPRTTTQAHITAAASENRSKFTINVLKDFNEFSGSMRVLAKIWIIRKIIYIFIISLSGQRPATIREPKVPIWR